MPSPEQVQAAVDAYVAAYQENDRDAFLDAFAADGVIVDPVGTPPHAGRDARGAFWDTVHQLTERMTFDVKDVTVCGSEAAMVFRIHAGDGRRRDRPGRRRHLRGRRRREDLLDAGVLGHEPRRPGRVTP